MWQTVRCRLPSSLLWWIFYVTFGAILRYCSPDLFVTNGARTSVIGDAGVTFFMWQIVRRYAFRDKRCEEHLILLPSGNRGLCDFWCDNCAVVWHLVRGNTVGINSYPWQMVREQTRPVNNGPAFFMWRLVRRHRKFDVTNSAKRNAPLPFSEKAIFVLWGSICDK